MKLFQFGSVLLLAIVLVGCQSSKSDSMLLVNHVGYPENGEKKVLLQSSSDNTPKEFEVVDAKGNVVFEGDFKAGGKVDNWHTGNVFVGLFSALNVQGDYKVRAKYEGNVIESTTFTIKTNDILSKAMPLMLKGLQSIHPAQKYEDWDSKAPFHGSREDNVDVHGGWYDASGDFSKYLTHLTYTNYMMPQQTPMVAYNLLAAAEYAQQQGTLDAGIIEQMKKESAWGADFLVRMADAEGYFYTIVFDTWSKDPAKREICAYETQDGTRTEDYKAAFREGAGISIAALAKLSASGITGEYSSAEYLQIAEKGFAHLVKNNTSYCDDGVENVLDDYCALMAASELYNATQKPEYLEYAQNRANNLAQRISSDDKYSGWFRADENGDRSYFHAAEAGYPIIALSRYLDIETDEALRSKAISTIQKAVAFEMHITNEVYNPFGYPRQYVKAVDEDSKRAAFFVPHVNESGYWYQGENARIASLSAAFNIAKPYMLATQQEQVSAFVSNQINWILGLNPYDVCMLDGLGHNNPSYFAEQEWNYEGGIANGITAGVVDENDIAFLPEPQKDDLAQNWRWPEQWIPHAGWFILALSTNK